LVDVIFDLEPAIEKESSEAPILFLDVNFGGDKLTRIVMYKGKSSFICSLSQITLTNSDR